MKQLGEKSECKVKEDRIKQQETENIDFISTKVYSLEVSRCTI